jgi:ATP-dependent helicase HrpA
VRAIVVRRLVARHSCEVADRRLAITYPEQLPVSQRKDDLARAIRDSQVVVVAGETGSGKTTQLPKICLELGRGQDGAVIGHTQPRRIAARTVAERIADELGTELGDVVGYTIRFTDRSSPSTLVKVMTDGILLAEVQRDRKLRRYDTIILDEAHERSLNIDFLLGYLKSLLPKRPDLKLIITSATIDPQRFAAHFDDAPIVEVSGRTYPVEVRYRELADDQITGIVDAVSELVSEGPGDILVFLSGEREIRDAADALGKVKLRRPTDAFDVVPLFARLSTADQHRVFAPHDRRRVVLATNVAETSLTVPGIRYVVDTGLARISRYSPRTKVQRLPIEPVSQASANQRKGRCGRVAPGICIRLYAEDDYQARPEFTDPEILRTNLASVILQMTALGLGDVARFPFLDPPDTRSVQAGVQLLEELGALTTGGDVVATSSTTGSKASTTGSKASTTGNKGSTTAKRKPKLTAVGRQLAQLPLDPRLGRMLIEASRNDCLRDVIPIAAALSIQDPRERPLEVQAAADAQHRRFADPRSDFASFLNLWRYVKEQQKELSSSAFRRLCKRDYLNYLRVREWQDLDAQLRQSAKQLGLKTNSAPAANEAIHRSLLAGLLSHVGSRDVERRDYLGARGTRFAIFPGSALARKPPDFVMAAELVETSRLFARVNAAIEPEWAEAVGAHLVKRSYSEPHWSKRRGAVMAREKVTLFGVPIVTDRLVNYGRIDPETARDLFIRHALVQREWDSRHRFLATNTALLDEAEELEHKARRRDIVVDEETLVDFYDERLPDGIVSAAHFDAWWKRTRQLSPDLLTFPRDLVVNATAAELDDADFPDEWRAGDAALPLRYTFDPGSDADGVNVQIPVASLPTVETRDFSWPVPGLRQELVVALIRSLPKRLRVNFVPAPNVAAAFLAAVSPGEEPLLDALERYLRRTTGIVVNREDWRLDGVPAHLRPLFTVVSDEGAVVATSRDLDALKHDLARAAQGAVSTAASGLERTGITSWDFGSVPREFSRTRAGAVVRGYPALVDAGSSVSLRVLATPAEQESAMPTGVRRLLMLAVPSPAPALVRRLDNLGRLELGLAPNTSATALLEDCYACAVDEIVAGAGGPAWDRAGFESLVRQVQARGDACTEEVLMAVRAALVAAAEVDRRLSGRAALDLLPALTDMKGQWSRLVYPGFVAAAGLAALRHYPRYFAAMQYRLDSLAADPRRDARSMASMAGVQAAYLHAVAAQPADGPLPVELLEVRWLLEELRVSLFAQHLKTHRPVSVQRVQKTLSELG